MDTIYQNGVFTIAVHDDGLHGFVPSGFEDAQLVQPASPPYAAIYVRNIDKLHAKTAFLASNGVAEYDPEAKPDRIYQRGWCYQERLLSRRILHFVKDEVIFESDEGIKCHCGKHWESVNHGLSAGVDWSTIVATYTKLHFTEPWDLLPGIAGIARRYQSLQQSGPYIAGLWKENLTHYLCWRSVPHIYGEWMDKTSTKGWNGICGSCSLKSRDAKCKPYPRLRHGTFQSLLLPEPPESGRANSSNSRVTAKQYKLKKSNVSRNRKILLVECDVASYDLRGDHELLYSSFGKPELPDIREHIYARDKSLHNRVRRAKTVKDATIMFENGGY